MTVQTVTVRHRMLIVSGSVIMRTVAVTVMTITRGAVGRPALPTWSTTLVRMIT